MRVLYTFFFTAFIGISFAIPLNVDDSLPLAQPCNATACKLPSCRCSSTEIPGNLSPAETPQFVFLTFDDAVRDDNYEFYKNALYGRKNPDGCNVSATLFASHQYTIYPKIHDLYENGIEIALHSITHYAQQEYWKTASVDALKKEFGGELQIFSKFAKVPVSDVHGMRLPFLQLSGNNSFETLRELGLEYDCSWPTQHSSPGLWPYTLDYKSTQECPIGPCPTASFPGVWVAPMLDWVDQKGIACAMEDQCVNIPTNASELVDWMKSNFERNYNGNRAPFGFFLHATWFILSDVHFQAYVEFLDYLQTLKDVYIVNISRGLEWIKNPVPIGSENWPSCPTVQKSPCESTICRFVKDDGSEIDMHICNSDDGCPANYPTPDNPLGQ